MKTIAGSDDLLNRKKKLVNYYYYLTFINIFLVKKQE